MLMPPSTITRSSLLRSTTVNTICIAWVDTTLPGYEDWDFYLGALERGWRGLRVPEVVLDYRRHESSRLSGDRADYRRRYRTIRAKHRPLYLVRETLGMDTPVQGFPRLESSRDNRGRTDRRSWRERRAGRDQRREGRRSAHPA